MLKIAHLSNVVDGRSNSGTARVAREIITEIAMSGKAHQYLIHFDDSSDPIYFLPNVTEILIPTKINGYGSRFRAFIKFWIHWRLGKNSLKFDVVHWHSSRVYPFFFIIPSFVTIVTLYDAGQRILKGVNTFSTRFFYWNLRLTHRFMDLILASSGVSAQDLIQIAKFPFNKTVVLNHGTRFGFVEEARIQDFEPPAYFFVCISRWQPHKNVSNLVRAIKLLHDEGETITPIVLVGKPVGAFSEPLDLIESQGLSKYFTILHDLTDSQLAFLLERAALNIFPSLHEGFGLSVLEGMARGCPPVVHSKTATSEVAGQFGFHLDMNEPQQLANLLKNRPFRDQNNSELMRQYVSENYNWTRITDSLISIYRKVLIEKG